MVLKQKQQYVRERHLPEIAAMMADRPEMVDKTEMDDQTEAEIPLGADGSSLNEADHRHMLQELHAMEQRHVADEFDYLSL